MSNLAIFASGSGSNAENIINYFSSYSDITIKLILTNNKDAYVIERAKKLNVPVHIFTRDEFYKTENVLNILQNNEIDFIVLAGFLWFVPNYLLLNYEKNIINIHPSLLPKYGGKGMYGSRVHEAVFQNKEKESGITIHYVNGEYDKGDVIFQTTCEILDTDSPDSIAEKVHALEYEHFPKIIESLLRKK